MADAQKLNKPSLIPAAAYGNAVAVSRPSFFFSVDKERLDQIFFSELGNSFAVTLMNIECNS